jgi:tRNA (mo5U34)-methyltransferase
MNTARFMIPASHANTGLAAEAAEFGAWFHNLHLPDGSETAPNHPLGDFPAFKWREIGARLPQDLTGWTALDIGCNAGFYSIELAKRGAAVTALDKDPQFLRQAEWAFRQFGVEDRIELRQGQVYDLAHWRETFDLVLFMGVFYHLRYPLLALDAVTEKARRLLIFQSLTMPGDEILECPRDLEIDERDLMLRPGWPKMAFIEHAVAGDATNWWAPNHAGVTAMLRSAGAEIVDRPGHEIYFCVPASRSWDQEEFLVATGQAPARDRAPETN